MPNAIDTKESLAASLTKAVIVGVGSGAGGKIGEIAAAATVQVLDRLGREVVAYAFSAEEEVDLNRLPPGLLAGDAATFAVIGLGRCGSRVTAQLARMIAESKRTTMPEQEAKKPSIFRSIASLLKKPKNTSTLRLEPVMVIGDINAATFAEVDGLGEADPLVKEVLDGMLRIDYRPLAQGGVGNVPLFGEFFTRGLLALPPSAHKDEMRQWSVARDYLLHLCSLANSSTRLAFYVFSAAGGSGSGAAAELMRSQRFAIKQRHESDPHIYYTGVAVIPEPSNENENQLRNTGRTIVQYLADLNIRLENADRYEAEQDFEYGTHLPDAQKSDRTALPPWDSLGIVSNEVMLLFAGRQMDQHIAERLANQYIAQQVFNLAAAQSQPKEFKGPDVNERPENITETPVQFEGVHLDTEDLRTGLRGPFAFGFAAAARDEVKSERGIEKMLLRAIAMPRIGRQSGSSGLPDLVEGISIAPLAKDKYAKYFDEMKGKDDDSASVAQSGMEQLKRLAEIAFFKRCPRLIFVLTSPIDSAVTVDMRKQIAQMLAILCPNLKQARFAIVRGTTEYYTLSIYFESSVVLCYDVARAITAYIRDCWKPRSRSVATKDFEQIYAKYVRDNIAPLPAEEIEKWLGEEELYGKNVIDFNNQANQHTSNWLRFVERLKKDSLISDADAVRLNRHSVQQCAMRPDDVLAAMRFVNYVAHVGKREMPEPPDFG